MTQNCPTTPYANETKPYQNQNSPFAKRVSPYSKIDGGYSKASSPYGPKYFCPEVEDFLLLENGFFLLQENNAKIIL